MKKRLDRAIKIQPEYHLIVTEGTDTEPEYFGSIKDVINKKYPEKIKLDVYGEGDNTISLFQKAKTRAEESSNVYKHVWIVYDTDDFPADHIDFLIHFLKIRIFFTYFYDNFRIITTKKIQPCIQPGFN